MQMQTQLTVIYVSQKSKLVVIVTA